MPRRPALETVKLTARVPRGQDHFWTVIRQLDSGGPWSVSEVSSFTSDHEASVRDYVRRLARAGIVHKVEDRRQGRFYRLTARPGAAPSLRRDGTVLPLPAQQRLWNAMRSMPQWTVRELSYAAAADAPVPAATADRYVTHLERAGYFTIVVPARAGRGGTQAVYRLRRAMNTGPLAPQILQVRAVLDRNRGEIVGEDQQAEAVS